MEGQIKETPFTAKQFEEYVKHKEKSEKLPNLSELSKKINTKPVLLKPLKEINHFNELPKLLDLSEFTEVNKLHQYKHTEYSWNKEETVKKPVLPKSLKEKNDSKKQYKKQHGFTKEDDDDRIIELYKKYPNQWTNIARELGTERDTRNIQRQYKLLIEDNKELKEQYKNNKRQCVDYSEKEVERIFELNVQHPSEWTIISKILHKEGFPKRTGDSIRKKFLRLEKKYGDLNDINEIDEMEETGEENLPFIRTYNTRRQELLKNLNNNTIKEMDEIEEINNINNINNINETNKIKKELSQLPEAYNKSQQDLLNDLNSITEEINKMKKELFQNLETYNTSQQDLLNDLNNTTKEIEEMEEEKDKSDFSYDYYNDGFLHDYDYKAMGYSFF